MPKSRSRSKGKRRSYVPREPIEKRPPKESPRWYGPTILAVMGLGVALIVANYMGLVPGGTNPRWLYLGLTLIAVGFVGATRWR